MVIRLKRQKQSYKPDYSIFEKLIPTLKLVGLGYGLLVVIVPAVAYALSIASGKTNTVDVIFQNYQMVSSFFKSVSGAAESKFLFPGPGDLVLAAIVLLYRRRWKVTVGFLSVSGIVYLIGLFFIDMISNIVAMLGPASVPGLTLECLFTAFYFGILLAVLFVPAISAYREQKHWKVILPCNILLGWVQPLWIVMTFFAFKTIELKKKSAAEAPVTQQADPQLHQRELKKKKKGFKKK